MCSCLSDRHRHCIVYTRHVDYEKSLFASGVTTEIRMVATRETDEAKREGNCSGDIRRKKKKRKKKNAERVVHK